MPFHHIIKRDGTEVPFKIEKISSAIEKAFIADGGNLEHNSRELAEAVVLFLEKNQSVKPPIEEIQDMVEVVLANLGYARVAQKYKKFREERRLARGRLFIEGVKPEDYEETYNSLIVDNLKSKSSSQWNPQVIQQKLIEDFNLSAEVARTISSEVERKIFSLNFSNVSTELIREFTNNILQEYGYGHLAFKDIRVGIPLSDIELLFQSAKNKNDFNNPEKIRATVATHALKQFSLQSIFSKETATAHSAGRMHIHGLGHPGSLVSGVFSVRQIAIDGLKMIGLKTESLPASHARVLATHINTYLACMRPYYYGPVSLSYLNIFFAPFLEKLSPAEIQQEAQNLIFVTSQNAYARGGEPLEIDFNLYSYIPDEIKNIPAIGPSGKLTGKNYGEYAAISLTFANALFDVWGRGDAAGNTFDYPIATIHYQQNFKNIKTENELLKKASLIASCRKNINFIKDPGETVCFSSQTHLQRSMICSANNNSSVFRLNNLQTISINLPHLLLRRGFKFKEVVLQNLENELNSILNIALQAHEEKRNFMLSLANPNNSTLGEIFKLMADGLPLADIRSAKACVGFVGLSEFTEMAVGESFYEGDKGLDFAKEFLVKFKACLQGSSLFPDLYEIEETPELVASYRLARRDTEKYPEIKDFIIQNPNSGVNYANSFYVEDTVKINLEQRLHIASVFHAILGLHNPVIKSPGIGITAQQILEML
jgi:ribonucleoside-triphosphate reductase